MSRKIEAFVIHLGRAAARKPQVERILAACPVPAQVLEAVDGRELNQAEVEAIYAPAGLYEPRYPFALSAGEIGCFLSHRKAWQAIVETGLDAGLVIEDDVEIDPATFERALTLALDHVEEHGLVQFQVRPGPAGAEVIAHGEGVALRRPDIVELRMSCTLYSEVAARRLLEFTRKFDRPVDTVVQMKWLTGLWPLVAEHSGVREVSAKIGGTTIQHKKRGFLDRIRHELLRPLYRYRVAKLSRCTAHRKEQSTGQRDQQRL